MIIKRQKIKELTDHLNKKEISLIVGPRQAGKTTLMKFLKDFLDKRGEKTLFLSLDFEKDGTFFVSQDNFVKKIELEFGDKKGYVFIDEIQRKENAGLFLKGIYDMELGHKLIISGSGSIELKEKIHESLAGRKRIFELGTVSFEEFVNFKTDYRYENRLASFFKVEIARTLSLSEEYLNFGGYPRVILEKSFSEKIKIIEEIYRSYIEKDISYLLKVEKIDAFNLLIKILAGQTGSLINYSEITNTLGVSIQTAKNYFWYAEKTFIIKRIPPYFKNIRKEISKSPAVYFYDLGLRNYALGVFGDALKDKESGFLFQNFIFNILREKIPSGASLKYWRTKNGAEVDFIIDIGKKPIAIEVKYAMLKKPKAEKSLISFINKHKPAAAFLVNKNLEAELKISGANVHFLPFWELSDEKFLTEFAA